MKESIKEDDERGFADIMFPTNVTFERPLLRLMVQVKAEGSDVCCSGALLEKD